MPENVTLESKAAIEAARAAYDALTDAQKEIFQKKYPEALANLEAAEARYEELKQQAEQEEIDKAAAQEVIKLINDIGGVESVTGSSGPKIRKARAAYDALTDAQKKHVTNYDVLVACEEAFAALPTRFRPLSLRRSRASRRTTSPPRVPRSRMSRLEAGMRTL